MSIFQGFTNLCKSGCVSSPRLFTSRSFYCNCSKIIFSSTSQPRVNKFLATFLMMSCSKIYFSLISIKLIGLTAKPCLRPCSVNFFIFPIFEKLNFEKFAFQNKFSNGFLMLKKKIQPLKRIWILHSDRKRHFRFLKTVFYSLENIIGFKCIFKIFKLENVNVKGTSDFEFSFFI